MPVVHALSFGSYRLDPDNERLWRGKQVVRLTRKAFAVLRHLVNRPGELITKEELFSTVWPGIVVSDDALTRCVRELRLGLKDNAKAPRYIETVHRRGFRFIAPVTTQLGVSSQWSVVSTDKTGTTNSQLTTGNWQRTTPLVGRETELAQLHHWLKKALEGERQMVFIAGEAGIGKTALVDAFVSEVATTQTIWFGRGQCIEHYGGGEAYLPLLEALGRLGRDTTIPVAKILRDHAPSWLAHLPSLVSSKERLVPAPVSPEKMLRELADALESLTARDCLILILEDLHWSDTATLDWLAYVARRRDPARLLVLGTYRPVEALLRMRPLRSLIAELRQHPQCAELVLDYLPESSIEAYLRQRCGDISRLKDFAETLFRRTGGHPLFLATIVDELVRQKGSDRTEPVELARTDLHGLIGVIPTSIRQFIEHHLEQLSEMDQTILEAASVTGDPFSLATIVAGTSLPEETIATRAAGWASEGRFVIAAGTAMWPDRTLAARYHFRHALFQEVVYTRMMPERRMRLHQRIGSRLEHAYGDQAATIAAELAMHFEQGGDLHKALSYMEQAARNALQRSAYTEARRHLLHGFEVLEALPEGQDGLRQEVQLCLLLGQVLSMTKGWGVEEVERVYDRVRTLCEELGDGEHLLPALWGLIAVNVVRAHFGKTRALCQELLQHAKKQRNPVFQIAAHMDLGGTAFGLGESISAGKHFRQTQALYDPRQHHSHVIHFGADLGLFSRIWETHLLWHTGYPEQARAQSAETLSLAAQLSHPFTHTITRVYAMMLHQFRRDVEEVTILAETTITDCAEHGFSYYIAWTEVLRGWSHATRSQAEQGIADIHKGLAVLQATGGLRLPYYRALLAEAYAGNGQCDEALSALADAFADVHRTEERWWLAELHRLRGECLSSEFRQQNSEAEECFHQAIAIARAQRAKSLELRAALSLSRLWQKMGKKEKARSLLATAYNWFTEGFDSPNLQEAKVLLQGLSE